MGKCVVFCAGSFDCLVQPLTTEDYVIAADGGLWHTNRLGITPNAVLGDFDSLGFTPEGANVFPVEKDDTDSGRDFPWAIGSFCSTEVWTARGWTTPWPISRHCSFWQTAALTDTWWEKTT